MVDYRLISEHDFRYNKSDYAKSLRAIYGEDGYNNYVKKVNSVMAEGKDKTAATNPMKESNTARVNYLTAALNQAVTANNKARNEYRNLSNYLSGMSNVSGVQAANLNQKYLAYGKTDMNEDLLRSSLMDAQHSQGMYYNA